MERWVSDMIPARSFGFVVLTTSSGIMDHEEAHRKHVAGKILGYFYSVCRRLLHADSRKWLCMRTSASFLVSNFQNLAATAACFPSILFLCRGLYCCRT